MLYEKNDLHYPMGLQWAPPFGEPHEVRDGVYWLRMPLPLQLDHINLWLLRDDDDEAGNPRWVIVDTGMYDEDCKAVWDKLFDSFLAAESVSRIVVTHFHPDHLGLASWLQQRCGCKVYLSEPEYRFYYHLRTRDVDAFALRADAELAAQGVDEATRNSYINVFGEVNTAKTLEEQHCVFLNDGAVLDIGGRQWRAVSGSGHSPLHLCWYCEDSGLLLSGDQALPRISSNISVFVDNPDSNPLLAWLDSCRKLQQAIAADTLVLPAHQEPFSGIADRMEQLIDGHEKQLDTLREALQSPQTVLQASHALFRAKLDTFGRLMAVSETLAHINYLLERGEIVERSDDRGPRYFSLAAA